MANYPIINLEELELVAHEAGENFEASFGLISKEAGTKHLGVRLTVLPPGKKAWPHHNHHGNDEVFVVLEGVGELRYGEQRYPLKKHDAASCPAGGRETAHQIMNTGKEDLKFLAISSMREPDITEYPDSEKLGLIAGSAPGGNPKERTITAFVENAGDVDYWKGED
ncbi:MAG: cupin domain-containing protein [Rhodospirillaceae bacterium]|jgi:uncharacterized cupin superfamily protein|nr:cupin domain-containing protein [Rhodospirillaceae bacterium]MBT7269060.1 cupin domain-containing protein [Rhodospirillaceae bacterium]